MRINVVVEGRFMIKHKQEAMVRILLVVLANSIDSKMVFKSASAYGVGSKGETSLSALTSPAAITFGQKDVLASKIW